MMTFHERYAFHVLSGVDNPAARLPGPGNGHHNSMSGLVSGQMFSGRGAGGPSIDQVIAQKIGDGHLPFNLDFHNNILI